MGDHRASIKIEFHMHGHEAKNEWWINWWPSDECFEYKVDKRILEWFDEQHTKAMDNWHDMQCDAAEAEAQRAKDEEYEEFLRLKEKFEG